MSTTANAPVLRSLAFADIPRPDYADVIVIPKHPRSPDDPEVWARAIFGLASLPGWVKALLALRQAMAPIIGVPRAGRDVFAVARVAGEEALIVADDAHLDFRCAVGVDPQGGLVRVTTVVRLHGWRGRAYFAPVRVLHPVVVTAMMRRAARDLARGARRG